MQDKIGLLEIKSEYKEYKYNFYEGYKYFSNLLDNFFKDDKYFSNLVKTKKELVLHREEDCHLSTCLINNNKNSYLCIIFKENLIIVNLLKRIIIKKINLNINETISKIKNWNNKNIILLTDNSFYIYNLNKFQVITKYSVNGFNCAIKTIFSKDHDFYGLICFNRLFYNLKKSSNKNNKLIK